MDDLSNIRTMNDKRLPGYWKDQIGALCNRIGELESAAHAAIDAWTEYEEDTPLDGPLADLARVLLKVTPRAEE